MRRRYVADFETTTTKTFEIEGRTRVWAWCIIDIDDAENVVGIGTTIDTFFKKLEELANCDIYFHNLKFDGGFILDYLFTNGYRYSEKKKTKTFSTLIDNLGNFYSMQVIIDKIGTRNYKSIRIYDSLKKLPLKVSQIAKAFDLSISKLKIDYDEFRPIGHELSPEEEEYVVVDCKIVAMALKEQFDNGLEKMTIGSDALTGFKKTQHPTAFRYFYPTLKQDIDDRIRGSYKGGWTYANPKFKKHRLNGLSYDVNSLYPAVMYGKYGALPVCEPIEFDGEYVYDKNYPLYILEFECKFKVKDGYLPTIQLKGNMIFNENEYIKDSEEVVAMCLTSVDYQLFRKHYNVSHLKVFGGFKFKAVDDLFRPYIDYWSKIKANSKGGKRQLAKLMLNSLYGKFGTNPLKQSKIPYYDKDKKLVRFTLGDKEYEKPVYTALASFVTSYARRTTITVAQNNIDRFIYADTDSVYLKGYEEPKGIEIHDTKIGAWKMEGKFSDSYFIRAKTYLKTVDGKNEVKCAGMPDEVKHMITYDNFKIGTTFKHLKSKRVNGGILLNETEYTIKP